MLIVAPDWKRPWNNLLNKVADQKFLVKPRKDRVFYTYDRQEMPSQKWKVYLYYVDNRKTLKQRAKIDPLIKQALQEKCKKLRGQELLRASRQRSEK